MFDNCGINCNNCSATTSNYIVRRTAGCHSRDTKVSSYQSERIQRYFDDNFNNFLFHGCIQEIKYIEKRENENSDAEHPRVEFLLKTSRKSKRKEPSDTPTVDDILSGVGLKKPKPKKAKVKPTVPLEM